MNSLLVRIRYDEALSSVASGLEALLFFRLKREWTERNRYSSLVEQMQLAIALGKSIGTYILGLHGVFPCYCLSLAVPPSSNTYPSHV